MSRIARIKEWFWNRWFEMSHDPNSAAGFRHRAERLVRKHGYSWKHPTVTMLLKQAEKEEEKEAGK